MHSPDPAETAKPIMLNALDRDARAHLNELNEVALQVIEGGWYVMGTHHDLFCSEFAAYCGVSHCLGVGNGTDALEIALRSVGVEAGDEVIAVANAGMYAAVAILAIGATPVYVDVEADTHLMAPTLLEGCISQRTRAIVATHLYGAPVDMDRITLIARARGIAVIEDCAQAHGAVYKDRRVGSLGDIAAFSFYPTKNLGALGDGGAVLTDSDALSERARALAQYGWSAARYVSTVAGGRNSRLDELQAGFLRTKLVHLDEMNRKRVDIHSRYARAIAGSPRARLLHATGSGVSHLAVLEVDDRAAAIDHFADRGVRTGIHYPVPDHRQPSLQGRFRIPQQLIVTERAAEHVLTIPCHPYLTEHETERICHALEELRP